MKRGLLTALLALTCSTALFAQTQPGLYEDNNRRPVPGTSTLLGALTALDKAIAAKPGNGYGNYIIRVNTQTVPHITFKSGGSSVYTETAPVFVNLNSNALKGRSLTIISAGSAEATLTIEAANGSIFELFTSAGVKLVLDGKIHLVGVAGNSAALLSVDSTNTLELRGNVEISGNTNTSTGGGGVNVASDGSFSMTGGKIYGNTAANGGGGVNVVSGGSFSMTGGEISGNEDQSGTDGWTHQVAGNGSWPSGTRWLVDFGGVKATEADNRGGTAAGALSILAKALVSDSATTPGDGAFFQRNVTVILAGSSVPADYTVMLGFNTAPSISFTAGTDQLGYTITHSDPSADSYDVYWIAGAQTVAATIKASTTKSVNATLTGTITGLTSGTLYSIIVTAHKAGYADTDSAITQGMTDYVVGNIGPGGGLIFYVDASDDYPGWRYLEASQTDLINIAWGLTSDTLGTPTGIGTGKTNTQTIVDAYPGQSYAANRCAASTEGGKDDWFLPSLDELHTMCSNLFVTGLDTSFYETGLYWSSSEQNGTFAYQWKFKADGSGAQFYNGKTNATYRVRAIRSF